MPVTVESVTLTRLTHPSVKMVRFGRDSSPRRMGWIYATLELLLWPVSGLYETEKKPTPCCKAPSERMVALKSLMMGMSRAVEQDWTQSLQSWLRCRECTGWTVLRRLSNRRVKSSKDQFLQPRDSQTLQSYSKGRNEIKVLWEEHPPRTLARECRMCEFPI